MRADNSHLVIAAARRRSATTRKRAVAALRRMEKSGRSITFDAVAREPRYPDPGSTTRPISAPRSNAFEPAETQPHQTGRSYRIDNAPPTPHSCGG